ncbi:MAG: TadE/TadG family type IV pilus assembly protein [Actinomycetota bacterium]
MARPRPFLRRRDESGIVIVWFTILLVVLLGVAALVVDILHAYSEAQRTQNAADAAALAGVVAMPNFPTAEALAEEVAKNNTDMILPGPAGFEAIGPGMGDPEVTLPTQLKVKVTAEIGTFFAGFPPLRVFDMQLKREAIAEYDPPVRMGSPLNTFGNRPDEPGGCVDPNCPRIWAVSSGPLSAKHSGDAAGLRWCDDTTNATSPFGPPDDSDNCPTNDALDSRDYEPDGSYYVIDVKPGTLGSLHIDLFDPVWVAVNNLCTDDNLAALGTPNGGGRYDSGTPNAYCTGDAIVPFQGWDTPGTGFAENNFNLGEAWLQSHPDRLNNTTFKLYPPDDTPLNPYDNQDNVGAVCDETYLGYANATFGSVGAAAEFRQWVPYCTTPIDPSPGPYVLRVQPKGGTQGLNYFSIAAYTGADRYSDSNVSIGAVDRMGVFTNDDDAVGTFYLARVIPSSVTRTLRVQLFDVGDCSGCGGLESTITVKTDPSTTIAGMSCEITTDTAITAGPQDSPWKVNAPAWGPLGPPGGCSSLVSRPSHNGQWITFDVTIPGGALHTCDVALPKSCWLQIEMSTPGFPAKATDTSTWTASFGGLPVRIIG